MRSLTNFKSCRNSAALNGSVRPDALSSGSAVFDADTGLVEGILVRGARDYIRNSSLGCYESNVYSNSDGRGEDVTRITNISELMDKMLQ